MRLLFVADGRSPIALNWIDYFIQNGDEVHLASTFYCKPEIDLESLDIVPVAFSGTKRASTPRSPVISTQKTQRVRLALRHYLGPLTITRSAQSLRKVIKRVKPDLVHAMRIPYEGMLAADAYVGVPLLVSVWGNDFTLHAPASPLMRHYTRWTMRVADALHADCQRDVRLAIEWGFSGRRSSLVVPGNGGVRTQVFFPPKKLVKAPIVINPRGFRDYVRNDVFFNSIPLVVKKIPQARFLCAAMAGDARAQQWIDELGIEKSVELLPPVPHGQMGELYRRAAVMISPSVHDGTPNTLLEAIACGCFPVVGDLESIREWITDRENGLLVDASDPNALAEAMLEALTSKGLRNRAAGLNAKHIAEKAEYSTCMAQVRTFYEGLQTLRS